MLSEVLTLTGSALNSAVGHPKQVEDCVADLNSCVEKNSNTTDTSEQSEASVKPAINSYKQDSPNHNPEGLFVNKDAVRDLTPVKKTIDEPIVIPEQRGKSLPQGRNISSLSTSDDYSYTSNDVIAERFKSGEKQRIFKEKLRPRQYQARNQRRIIHPTVVKENTTSHVSQSNQHSCADLMTSAVAPFAKIQETLGNQITNLVSTLQSAHIAEKELITRSEQQKQELRENELFGRLDDVYQEMKYIRENCEKHGATRSDDIKPSHNRDNDRCLNYKPTYRHLNEKQNIETSTFPVQKKEHQIQKTESSITKRKGKLKSQGKEIMPQVALLQTPVPRRKPPKPLSSSPKYSKGSVVNHHTSPKLSNRGLALLKEIMADQSTPGVTMEKHANQKSPPPRSQPRPIIR